MQSGSVPSLHVSTQGDPQNPWRHQQDVSHRETAPDLSNIREIGCSFSMRDILLVSPGFLWVTLPVKALSCSSHETKVNRTGKVCIDTPPGCESHKEPIPHLMIPSNITKACQQGLGACGASLSSPGRLVLSDLTGAQNGQTVNVRQDHILCTVTHSSFMTVKGSMILLVRLT